VWRLVNIVHVCWMHRTRRSVTTLLFNSSCCICKHCATSDVHQCYRHQQPHHTHQLRPDLTDHTQCSQSASQRSATKCLKPPNSCWLIREDGIGPKLYRDTGFANSLQLISNLNHFLVLICCSKLWRGACQFI